MGFGGSAEKEAGVCECQVFTVGEGSGDVWRDG